MRYLVFIIALFAALQTNAQNNIVYGAGISYTNGVPSWTPNPRTSRAAVDTVTGRWYHFNTPGGWQWIGNTVEEIAGCAAPAYTPNKGDSRLVINNCVKSQVYWYDGTVWKWINQGEVYTAGQGIRIESNTIILDSLYVLRFRTGSNTDGAAGTMSWNATEETVDLVTDQGAVTGHLMESAYYNTRNTTGTPITIGTVVMAAGTTGNTGRILIAPAIADGTVNSEYILGITAQTIGNNSNGKVQHFGKIRGIQTNGANYGETWVDGDVLYCSAVTPGYLTKVLPTAPNLKVPIAIVIHAHPSNGTLFVRPSHFPDLAQINDVQLSSPTNGQVLTYNSALSRWENATPANQLQTLSTDNTPGNISISSGNTITLNVNDADASATNELQTLSVTANTATLSNSGGSVTIAGAGINTVGTAGTTITVTGTEVDGSTTNELQTLSTGTNTLTLSNGGGTVTVDTNPADDVTGSGANGRVAFWTGTQTQTGDSDFTWDDGNNRFGILANSGNFKLNITSNTTDNFARFNDGANDRILLNLNGTAKWNITTIGGIEYGGSGGNPSINMFTGATWNQNRFDIANAGTVFRLGYNALTEPSRLHVFPSGNISIGANSDVARLRVQGSGTSSSTWTAQFHNASTGGNNALMIRDDGNVGIGTSSPTQRLHVEGQIYAAQTITTLSNLRPSGNVLSAGGIGSSTGAQFVYSAANSFLPNTGNATLVAFLANNTINQTGSANGITRGFWCAPILTSFTDFRAFEFNNNSGWGFYGAGSAKSYFAGNVAIGTTTQDASSAFEVASTTQGILFPRMTTTQRNAIATPADGLVIYNTTDNKLQVRAGGAWVDLH